MDSCNSIDIEDMAKHIDVNSTTNVRLPSVISYKKTPAAQCKDFLKDCQLDSFVPGTHSIYCKTWGCAHNNSDSEYMMGQLVASGYVIATNKELADLWLLNSCTVKTPAEQHLQNLIDEACAKNKPVVVAGCVSQATPNVMWLKGLSIVGVQQIDRIVEVVEETLKGNCVRLLNPKRQDGKKLGGASLALPKIRKNPLIEILAINTGCLNSCTYCKTKHARGNLGSYPIEELVQRAVQAFSEGCREIWLTSEDLGAYGRDIGVTLPDLLYRLVEVIPEGCMMRLGMTNPPYILDHVEDIAKVLNHERVYSFLHIPVQSGNDAVLRDMKREYSSADFEKVVDFLRANVEGVNIATDVICGFPTELPEDFMETVKLVEKYKFNSLFINQFYPRPGTPAARLKLIDTVEIKRRTKLISALFRSYMPYDDRVGKVYDVLVTEEASDRQHYVGHNKSYEQILVPKNTSYLGSVVKVRIVSTTKFSMEGVPIEMSLPNSSLVDSTTTTKENKANFRTAMPISRSYGQPKISFTVSSYNILSVGVAAIGILFCWLFVDLSKWFSLSVLRR